MLNSHARIDITERIVNDVIVPVRVPVYLFILLLTSTAP